MKITNIEDNIPHEVSELICLKCLHRWIGVYPETTLLKELQCKCGEAGYVIKTGQSVVDYNGVDCYTCSLFVNDMCKLKLSYNSEIGCGYYKNE